MKSIKLFDALEYLVKNKSVDEFLADTGKLSSALKDLCISTRTIRDEASVFCQIDQKLKIFKTLKKDAKSGKDELIGKYSKVKTLVAQDVFEKFITAVAGLLDPTLRCVPPSLLDQGAPTPQKAKQPKKTATKPTESGNKPTAKKEPASKPATQPKPVATPKPVTPKPVQPKPVAKPKPQYTPPPQPQRAPKPAKVEPGIFEKCYYFIFTIIALCLFGIASFIAMVSGADWDAWQWVIGVGGGLVIATVLLHIFLGVVEDDEGVIQVITYIVSGLIVVNIVLYAVFGGIVMGVFFGFSGVLLATAIFFACVSFFYYETPSGIINIVNALVALIGALTFILIANFFDWSIMQWFVAFGVVIVLFAAGAPIVYILDDEGDSDYYTTVGIIVAVVTLVNIVLQSLIIDLYAVIYYIINGASFLLSIVFACITFEDYEDEWGWFFILECLLTAFAILYSAVFKPFMAEAAPWIFGIGGAAIVTPMVVLFLRRLEDDYIVEGYSLGTLICAIVQAANVIAMLNFGESHFITFLIVSTVAFMGALAMVITNVATEELGFLICLNIIVLIAIPVTAWLFAFDGIAAISNYFATILQTASLI